MTTIVLPEVDRSTIDELRKKMPDLKEIELPSFEIPRFEKLGKSADDQVDRLRGRARPSPWSGALPWIAAGIGLVAIIGAIVALMSWNRRSSWSSTTTDPWTEDALGSTGMTGMNGVTEITEISATTTDLGSDAGTDAGSGLGLTAAEASLMSHDPSEDRGL